MQKKLPLVVILQCYNKEYKVTTVAEQIISTLKNLIKSETILDSSYLYLIDEDSTDQTWYEIGKIVAKHPGIAKAMKIRKPVKSSALIGNIAYCRSMVVNFKNYNEIEYYVRTTNESIVIDKLSSLKDIFKSSKYTVIGEF